MDYLVELARHPDVVTAIEQVSANGSAPARELRRLGFLREEHPTAWLAEMVHAFYKHPDLACAVWVNLRYCDGFRRQLAEAALVRRTTWWKPTAKPAAQKLVSDETADLFRTTPQKAILELAQHLAASDVDALCEEEKLYPEPPAFLADLLNAEARTTDKSLVLDRTKRHARVGDYLKNPRLVRDIARDTGVSIPFSMVLEAELELIKATRKAVHRAQGSHTPSQDHEPYALYSVRHALDQNLLGLAFSGGGIRSATFNLGVLQALSKIGLLKHFDYLSTVSGGGYIGSWFAAWTHRESLKRRDPADAIAEMQRRLSPARSPNPLEESVKPIRFLREYSNYLTPRAGFFSADTWTMLGIYIRNALLNQVIIIALFAAVLLFPRQIYAATEAMAAGWWTLLPLALWAIGTGVLIANLRRLDPHSSEASVRTEPAVTTTQTAAPPWYAQPRVIQGLVILPCLIAALLVARQWGGWALLPINEPVAPVWVGGVVGASLLLILSLGRVDRSWADQPSRLPKGMEPALTIVGSVAMAGGVAAALTWVLRRVLLSMPDGGLPALHWHLNTIGTAGLVSVLSLSIVVMLGMLGEKFPDEHREWWSRLRTFLHVYAVAWLLWFGASIYVPWGIDVLRRTPLVEESGIVALIAWVASTIFGVQRGQSAEEGRLAQAGQGLAPPAATGGLMRRLAIIAPFVFIVGLVVLISLAIDGIFRVNAPSTLVNAGYWTYARWTTNAWATLATVGCIAVGLLFSWRVDINEFSIHHFYKNRLVRCYLGASRTGERKADWFTGFDPNDDVRLAAFDRKHPSRNGECYPGPYPIVNCALNLVGGQDLAWQERKATSFVFTPLYSGYDVDRAVLTRISDGQLSEGYVPTKQYYCPAEGPLLGMAMAISGAAANPNMGRATSPALAFLMTVFNVRLGWWIGNPRRAEGAALPGPRLGLTYTALELFGGTDDTRKYVNLSDGGHFDNLGVYELVRRGCRYIVVCDAGQDRDLACQDLGDLVRRCRTDFGVEIDIAIDRIAQLKEGLSPAHCVVGEIHYLNIPRRDRSGHLIGVDESPLAPGNRPAHEKGYLVYVKPSITGDEPQDVLEYRRRVPEFPHESTADQWFGESQFESYRKLGMHVAEQTFARYQHDDMQRVSTPKHLFERLHRYWHPPSMAINERSTQHTMEYSRLLELVRSNPNLASLDRALFKSLQLPETQSVRDEFYVCNALIQLIENVYADLDLERNYDHPHVQGWMHVFRRWAQQAPFRRTWRAAESTYAERFRNFYNDRLRGRPLGLRPAFIAAFPKAPPGTPYTLEAFTAQIEAGAGVIAMDVATALAGSVISHSADPGVAVGDIQALLRSLKGKAQLALGLDALPLAQPLVDALVASQWSCPDFAVTSRDRKVLDHVRSIYADVRVGLVVDDADTYKSAFDGFLDLDVDFLVPREKLLDEHHLHDAEEHRVPLVPWTVDEEDRLRMFFSHPIVVGLVTGTIADARRVKKEFA